MAETVKHITEQQIDASISKETVLDKWLAGREQQAFVSFLASAFICLIRRNVRLDTPGYESIDGGLPETLLWDASKLAKVRRDWGGGGTSLKHSPTFATQVRDVMDTVTLISTLTVLLRQVMARGGVMGDNATWLTVQRELLVLVQSRGVKMPDLEAYVVSKAREMWRGSMPEDEVESTKRIINNAANEENAVFKLYMKRTDKMVFEALRVGIRKECWGKEGENLRELIAKAGFASFGEELTKCLVPLIVVFKHTMLVHNEWYAEISVDACKAGQAAADAAAAEKDAAQEA